MKEKLPEDSTMKEKLPKCLVAQDLTPSRGKHGCQSALMFAPTAICEGYVGSATMLWHGAHVRNGATIGNDCSLGNNSYVDEGVRVGNSCKIGNGAQLFGHAWVGDNVFIGPNAMLINDKNPRAADDMGNVYAEGDWKRESVVVESGASIGAGAIIMPGITVGEKAVVGAGSVVTKNIPSGEKWVGTKPVAPPRQSCPIPLMSMSALYRMLYEAIDEKDWDDVAVIATELRNTEGPGDRYK